MQYCAWELLLLYIESIEIGYLIGISNKLKLKLIKGLKKKTNMSQLLATQLVMMEKDREILKLKAELARQQNSIQQTSEQNLTKQQKEFQEQIEQIIVQKEAERSALKSQVQQLKTRFLQNSIHTCSPMVHLCSQIPHTQPPQYTIQ